MADLGVMLEKIIKDRVLQIRSDYDHALQSERDRTRRALAGVQTAVGKALSELGIERTTRIIRLPHKKNGKALTNGDSKAHPQKGPRDFSCRVEGCKHTASPRFGFICGEHRQKLSAKEQNAVKKAYSDKKQEARAT